MSADLVCPLPWGGREMMPLPRLHAYLDVGRGKGTGWGVEEKEMKEVRGK